jgi:Holliday junction resolvase RusA-like endonuclease
MPKKSLTKIKPYNQNKDLTALYNRINIKPLSVNQAWQGRRFKTYDYKKYETNLLSLLPPLFGISKSQKYLLRVIAYQSNMACDWDNPIKPFQDVLQKKYDFNDSMIYEAIVSKRKVKRGEEAIEFGFYPLDESQDYTEQMIDILSKEL